MVGTPPTSPSVTSGPAVVDEEAAAAEAQRLAKERQDAYAAAMARTAKADADAVAAAKALDAARALAAQERAAAAAATLAPSGSSGSSGPHAAPTDLHTAMLLQEAIALLNLLAQAVAVHNIRSLIPIVLDVDSGQFSRWRDQFLLTLGKFSLQDHIHLDAPVLSPDWVRMDCVVKSWIPGTLADDLAEVIASQGSSARDAWLAVES